MLKIRDKSLIKCLARDIVLLIVAQRDLFDSKITEKNVTDIIIIWWSFLDGSQQKCSINMTKFADIKGGKYCTVSCFIGNACSNINIQNLNF